MLKKSWWSALALLLALLLSTTSYAAGAVTVPQDVAPVKSWAVVLGTTYKIPDDVKQSGDSYASSNTAIVTVNAETGQFTPQSVGVAYIVATNSGQSRYFKVTASAGKTISTALATNVFDGYTVTVADSTTPATNMRGKVNDPSTMCFVSVADKELGSISYTDYWTIIHANAIVVKTEGGGSISSPPNGYTNWNVWFADQFNAHRGLNADSLDTATGSEQANTVEEYRQELVRLVNVEREKAGLEPFVVNQDAMKMAQIRAEEISTKYSHERPDGTYVGAENIGAQGTPSAQVQSWMNSAGHKTNILHPNAVGIGVGCYPSPVGPGYYWVLMPAHDNYTLD